MSFEKLNQTSFNNIHERSCIIIVNANKKEASMIKNIGRLIGIKDSIFLDSKNGKTTIADILDNKLSSDNDEIWTNKVVIFNNMNNTKINGFLENLRKMKIARPLSAVVTETNMDWTLNKLVYNLIEERKALKAGQTVQH